MPKIDLKGKRVLISRTDSIGDVMLTLPICSWIKRNYTDVHIAFLGKGYTESIIKSYSDVDEFLNWDDVLGKEKEEQINMFRSWEIDTIIHVFPNKEIARLAKKASIKNRVGTSHRLYHLTTCNVRLDFTRKNSTLHEAQLNHELLKPFGLQNVPTLIDLNEYIKAFTEPQLELSESFKGLSNYTILHPKSQGSAKEWPIEKYMELALEISKSGKTVVFTGTENEGLLYRESIPKDERIIDSTGKFKLEELMKLIAGADNLVACSTGPLHIAGFYGVNTIGLFSPKRPIHPGRWKPLGHRVSIVLNEEACPSCQAGNDCDCILKIGVKKVLDKIV